MIAALKMAAAAGYILAATQGCPNARPVEGVQVTLIESPPEFRTDKTSAELGDYKISTTYARSRSEVFIREGVHMLELKPQYLVRFDISDAGGGQVCVTPMRVQLTVEHKPHVFIASELPQDGCRYKVVAAHELRHVNTDVVTLNEFVPRWRAALQKALDAMPPMGPMAESSIETAKDRMVDQVTSSLMTEVDAFYMTSLQRQQLIDTRQQYLMEGKLCQGQ